jgi:hypothetical protein
MPNGLRPCGTGTGVDGRLPARLTLRVGVRMRYTGLVLVGTGLGVRLLRERLAALRWVRLAGLGLSVGRLGRALRCRRRSSGRGLTGPLRLLPGDGRRGEPVTALLGW